MSILDVSVDQYKEKKKEEEEEEKINLIYQKKKYITNPSHPTQATHPFNIHSYT